MNSNAANDRFEIYFAEKLWEMIPSIYRHQDGVSENSGVLRALVEVLAGQAAILRRSHDDLWDDQFIELCYDWAVPYIADLVATHLLPEGNKRGRRADVANTILYRRRKGTLEVADRLISDITDWDGKVVENFRRLVRTRHGLDPVPGLSAGRFSGTLPGGSADLRRQGFSELAGGPFEDYFHTIDVRKFHGSDGRYNIPKLAFYLYRLKSYPVRNVTPFAMGDGLRFSFDPSGRDIPLFNRRNRSNTGDRWRTAFEWELPVPMRCRLLGHAEFEFDEAIVQDLVANVGLSAAGAAELSTLVNRRFDSESILKTVLKSFANFGELLSDPILLPLLRTALVEDCGKKALISDTSLYDASVVTIAGSPEGRIFSERISAGNLADWSVNAPAEKRAVIAPEKGRIMFLGNPLADLSLSYFYGFSGNTGAGTFDRRAVEASQPTTTRQNGGVITNLPANGVLQINDNKTYTPVHNKSGIVDLTLQSANQTRPYLSLHNSSKNWILEADAGGKLVLDGLWIGAVGAYEIILRGTYESVLLRNCTLDPGGSTNIAGDIIFPLPLMIEGKIEKMTLEACITGPIRTRINSITQEPGMVETLEISDSIIQSVDGNIPALQMDQGKTSISRTTVFGDMRVHRLEASDTLIAGIVTVTDTQNSCFRFSAAIRKRKLPIPVKSRLPQPYESFLFDETQHWFGSRQFGHPAYGQLSETAPDELRRGAENKSEMGAFCLLNNPVKLDSLRAKVEEYMPSGLVPVFINET